MKLEVIRGNYHYPHGTRQVIRDLDFSVESGQIVTVLGPNGAGKTTLLRCTLGLLEWNSGQTLLDGENIRNLGARRLWQRIAYVPQAKQSNTGLTVEETVLLGRNSHIGAFAAPARSDMLAVNEAMERLHIESLRQRKCSQLSGGELQMVLIARALAAQPQILVLDEPESNLDFRNQLLVLDALTELARDGMACLFNTHYPAHALRRADRALMLGRNGDYLFGPVSRVVNEEHLAEFFGVKTVIGEIETESNVYRDVVALGVGEHRAKPAQDEEVIATLSIILPDRSQTEAVNHLLHQAASNVLGRMGMPCQDKNIYIINLVLQATQSMIQDLNEQLNRIPGVSAKATYTKDSMKGN